LALSPVSWLQGPIQSKPVTELYPADLLAFGKNQIAGYALLQTPAKRMIVAWETEHAADCLLALAEE